MAGFENSSREYEARRFPLTRRLDLHGEGPSVARDRALHWIQSFAHEEPGAELLLIVERGGRPGAQPGPVRRSVEKLLEEISGGLIEWWSPFASGSLAVRIAERPRRLAVTRPRQTLPDHNAGRTSETASAAGPDPALDIPAELRALAHQLAELRRGREGLSVGLLGVVLRRVWIETQAIAMDERVDFETALEQLLERERAAAYEDHES
jgi:hypothetical protein